MNDLEVKKNEVEEVKVTAEDIKKYLCPSATDKELYMAMNIIKSYNLNPFKREVYIVKYGSQPAQIVVGYEVYIKRAEASGKLNGWKCEISEDGQKAKTTIYRKDWNEPFVWEVDKKEFDKAQAMWKTQSNFMLKKVCIGMAFRLCFTELSGLPYMKEEVDNFYQPIQDIKQEPKAINIKDLENEDTTSTIHRLTEENKKKVVEVSPEVKAKTDELMKVFDETPDTFDSVPDLITPQQLKFLQIRFKELKNPVEMKDKVKEKYNVSSSKELYKSDMDSILKMIDDQLLKDKEVK